MITCGGCADTWTGLSRCHCSRCHETFAGIDLFDRHQKTMGVCIAPAHIRRPAGRAVWRDEGGIWHDSRDGRAHPHSAPSTPKTLGARELRAA